MRRSQEELLREALTHFELVRKYASANDVDQLVIDALCMRLSAGIEVLARLDADTRERLFGDSWSLMWGMRNRIAHGYLLLNSEIVQQTVKNDLPTMVQAVNQGLESES